MFTSTPALIDFFLRLQRSLQLEAKEFRALKHDRDLCPGFQKQLELILEAYGRFSPIVYDTQGFSDEGVDVAVRYEGETAADNQSPHLVGLQLKSFDDCKSKGFLSKLKAQRDDAFRKVSGLEQYYIVLCTDEIRDKRLVRLVSAEFKSADKTRVIEPTYAHNFFRMSERRIEGLVTRAMLAEDLVFRRAMDSMAELPTQSSGILSLSLVAHSLRNTTPRNVAELTADPALASRYQVFLDELRHRIERMREAGVFEPEDEEDESLFETRQAVNMTVDELIARDLDLLEGGLIDIDSITGEIGLSSDYVMPLLALLSDAQVRYDLDSESSVLYAMEALGILEV